MKTISHILCTLAIATGASSSAHAQKLTHDQVPAAVHTAFSKAFPEAIGVKWKMEGTQYQGDFETGLLRTDHEVWYDATGRLLRHEEDITASDLPAAVSAAIASEFPGYRVDDVERITMNGAVSYVAELKLKGQQEWKVAYDAAGKQLQKQID